MLRYLAGRLFGTLITLWGVTLLCFVLLRSADFEPAMGGQAGTLSPQALDSEALAHLRAYYGLDAPWLQQYGRLVWRLVSLDLGTSFRDGRLVVEVLAEALPVTLLLSGAALVVAYAVALPLGVLAALRVGSYWDRGVMLFTLLLYALPLFWVGTALLVFLGSGRYVDCPWTSAPGCFPLQGLRSLPGSGGVAQAVGGAVAHQAAGTLRAGLAQLADLAFHLVLPVLTLSYGRVAGLARHTRSALIEALDTDYVRAARARGLPAWRVVAHALRNSLLPLVSLLGLEFSRLVAGSALVEVIFGVHGMGWVTLQALRLPDYPLVITNVALMAAFTAVGLLCADVLYVLVDPRLRAVGQDRLGVR